MYPAPLLISFPNPVLRLDCRAALHLLSHPPHTWRRPNAPCSGCCPRATPPGTAACGCSWVQTQRAPLPHVVLLCFTAESISMDAGFPSAARCTALSCLATIALLIAKVIQPSNTPARPPRLTHDCSLPLTPLLRRTLCRPTLALSCSALRSRAATKEEAMRCYCRPARGCWLTCSA